MNGVWGTVCGLYFDSREATVFCRTLGYRDGRVDYSSSYPDPPTSIYQASFWCTGDEDLLENCPHQGWKAATSSYCRHSNDAKVICFDDGVSCLWIYSSLSPRLPVLISYIKMHNITECDLNNKLNIVSPMCRH